MSPRTSRSYHVGPSASETTITPCHSPIGPEANQSKTVRKLLIE